MRCPICGGHEQLNCFVGASECCDDCTVSHDTRVHGGQEFSCSCGCYFTRWDDGEVEITSVPVVPAREEL